MNFGKYLTFCWNCFIRWQFKDISATIENIEYNSIRQNKKHLHKLIKKPTAYENINATPWKAIQKIFIHVKL